MWCVCAGQSHVACGTRVRHVPARNAVCFRCMRLQVPALLALPSSALAPGSLGGTRVDVVLDVCATYEFYTSQWLVAAAKEQQPQQMASFSSLHT